MRTEMLWLATVLMFTGHARAEQRVLRHEMVIPAPVSEVWKAFTTSEGVRQWMAPVADVDLKLGGSIRTNYKADSKPGDPGTIVHRILSYEPERMISTQFTAPEGASGPARTAQAVWWVARMEPLPDGNTRLTYTGIGWGEGPEWDAAYQFFDRGNARTLEQLVNYLEKRKPEPRP